MRLALIVDFVALLISLISVIVTGVLVGVLGLQQAYGYIKAVKRLSVLTVPKTYIYKMTYEDRIAAMRLQKWLFQVWA